MKTRILPLILGSTLLQPLKAQDSLLTEVPVNAPRHRLFTAGSMAFELDTTLLKLRPGGDLTAALQYSGIPVGTQSPGGLTTLQNRGTQTAQNTLYWNGVPLNSPALGSLDLNWFRSMPGDEWTYVASGQTSLHGSGSAGGSLYLDQRVGGEQGVNLVAGVGGYGWRSLRLNLRTAPGTWQFRSSFLREQAEMNYPYEHPRGGDSIRQNAGYAILGFQQGLAWNMGKSTKAEAQVWVQQHQLQIPGNIYSLNRKEEQGDFFVRTALLVRHKAKRGVWRGTVSWNSERETYLNLNARIDDTNSAQQFYSEAEYRLVYRKILISCGVTGIYVQASGGQKRNAERYQGAFYLMAKGNWGRHDLELGQRLEGTSDGLFSGWAPSLGYVFHMSDRWRLKAKAQRHYRFPTLNDFYWYPGGNPDLKPEKGYQSEAGVWFVTTRDQPAAEAGIQIFSLLVDNWVLWVTQENTGQPTPRNVREVWSRGAEFLGKLAFRAGEMDFILTGSCRYTRAEVVKSNRLPDAAVGHQLRYTPYWNGGATFAVTRKAWKILLGTRYMGTRNELANENPSGEVDAYLLTDLTLGYDFKFGSSGGTLSLAADNVLNTAYAHFRNQPMPGRFIKAQIQLNLQ